MLIYSAIHFHLSTMYTLWMIEWCFTWDSFKWLWRLHTPLLKILYWVCQVMLVLVDNVMSILGCNQDTSQTSNCWIYQYFSSGVSGNHCDLICLFPQGFKNWSPLIETLTKISFMLVALLIWFRPREKIRNVLIRFFWPWPWSELTLGICWSGILYNNILEVFWGIAMSHMVLMDLVDSQSTQSRMYPSADMHMCYCSYQMIYIVHTDLLLPTWTGNNQQQI